MNSKTKTLFVGILPVYGGVKWWFVLFFLLRVFRKRTAVLDLKPEEKASETHRYAVFMQKQGFRQSASYALFCETYMFRVAKDKLLHSERRSFAP